MTDVLKRQVFAATREVHDRKDVRQRVKAILVGEWQFD
jgi:hypothetical protein